MEAELLEKAAYILKTIAHPTRIAIIKQLSMEEQLTVNELCQSLKVEQSVASHHLINMKLKGLLQSRKSGINVYYSLKEPKLIQIIQCVSGCKCNM
jgi:DNA-binding transcriptional ArsR family regulator